MINDILTELKTDAMSRLQGSRSDDGMWRGWLSSSAISTSVSVFALQRIDAERYEQQIKDGVRWLHGMMKEDGSWGDSAESPSNMTATLLTYVSLYAVGEASALSRNYLNEKFGGDTQDSLVKGVLDYYGKDLTFSVPILMMCALAGVIDSWKKIPPFPFELATLPQSLFRHLNLPVVSYAIPALIAIGICQMEKKGGFMRPLRRRFVPKALRVLQRMQPLDGGFLEAAPLTAFVGMCMAEGGYRDHEVTQRCAKFLVDTVREDGSWPIDTNLSCWVTSLSVKVLPANEELSQIIRHRATTARHPFTAAPAGGWGWSDLSGSVPDGDDTSGALVALHRASNGTFCPEVENGLEWLMKLQNNDGGMPTFCKGWGKLPFDRSAPDITAHAILAMGIWLPALPPHLQKTVGKSLSRMMKWMAKQPQPWVPLWFGDQDAPTEKAPVYGTATAIDYLMSTRLPEAIGLAQGQIDYIAGCQNEDGGWGGDKGIRSKVCYTARAMSALAHFPHLYAAERQRGWEYLHRRFLDGTLYEREPVGLYFSRLWYSEDLYNITFLLRAIEVAQSVRPTK